jgi:hypothetical protein
VFPTGWITTTTAVWRPAPPVSPPVHITTNEPRYDPLIRGVYQTHMEGTGGPCSIFNPPSSYWCAVHPSSACPSTPDSRYGPAGQKPAVYGLPPVGMQYAEASLPHAPYDRNKVQSALYPIHAPYDRNKVQN